MFRRLWKRHVLVGTCYLLFDPSGLVVLASAYAVVLVFTFPFLSVSIARALYIFLPRLIIRHSRHKRGYIVPVVRAVLVIPGQCDYLVIHVSDAYPVVLSAFVISVS